MFSLQLVPQLVHKGIFLCAGLSVVAGKVTANVSNNNPVLKQVGMSPPVI